jgi:hypothetical protein
MEAKLMRRTKIASLAIAGLCLALLSAACGKSGTITSGDPVTPVAAAPAALGNATVQGSVLDGTEGLRVDVAGTQLTTTTDMDGRFALSRVPAGTVTLLFQGTGVNAKLVVPGVQDGKVTTITVNVSGSSATMPKAPTCDPSADTFFTGTIESISGKTLVVDGHSVDVSQVKKIWRGSRRINLDELKVGEKIKVWGKLRSDGVVIADEIALIHGEPGDDGTVWIGFNGVIQAISSSAVSQSCVYPTLVVSGTTVATGSGTSFVNGDGTTYDAATLAVGQKVYVEGWKKSTGAVNATLVRR